MNTEIILDIIKSIEEIDKNFRKKPKKYEITKFYEWSKNFTSRNSIYSWLSPARKFLKFLDEKDKNFNLNTISRNTIREFGFEDQMALKNCRDKAFLFLEELPDFKMYIASNDSSKETFVENTSNFPESNKSNGGNDIEWYFHYFSINKQTKRPEIVRTILQMFQSGKAILYNCEHLVGEDYEGKWHKLNESNVYSFTLYNENLSRELHFKFLWREKARSLIIGSYNTYDKEKLYSGSFLMKKKEIDGVLQNVKIEDKLTREKYLDILILTDYEKAIESNVDDEIIDYLSVKRRNYYKVPDTFTTSDGLKRFLKSYDPFKNRGQLFFEPKKPRVFISFPQTASKRHEAKKYLRTQDKIQKYISTIQDSLVDKADIVYRRVKEVGSHSEVSKQEMLALHKTKYFILILTEMNYVSFALVELGYALAYVKNIYVLCNGKILSKRFKQTLINFNIKYRDDIDENTPYAEMCQDIITYIDHLESGKTN